MARERPPQIDPKVMKELTKVSPWFSTAWILVAYAGIFTIIWATNRLSGGAWWAAYLLALVLIGGIQNALATFLHDGAHYHIHPNRQVNDLITDTFCGIPFVTPLRNYRHVHLMHHRYTGDQDHDPERVLYAAQDHDYRKRGARELAWLLCKDLFAINIIKSFAQTARFFKQQEAAGKIPPITRVEQVNLLAVIGGSLALCWYFGLLKNLLLFWLVPLMTTLFFFIKLHGYGEHNGADGPSEYDRTWLHKFNRLEDWFIYPIHSGYHIEHHMYLMVPWYHLPRLHDELMKIPEYRKRAGAMTLTSFFFGKNSVVRRQMLKTRARKIPKAS